MKEVSKEVKSGSPAIVIGIAKVQQAETAAECIKIAGTEATMVEVFNRQWLTDQMNKIRKPVADPCVALLKKTDVKLHPALIKVFKENGLDVKAAEEYTKSLKAASTK